MRFVTKVFWFRPTLRCLLPEVVYDRQDNAIYLTDERWDHILKFHEEMADFKDELFTTLKRGRRRQDPLEHPSILIFTPLSTYPEGIPISSSLSNLNVA